MLEIVFIRQLFEKSNRSNLKTTIRKKPLCVQRKSAYPRPQNKKEISLHHAYSYPLKYGLSNTSLHIKQQRAL